MKKTILSLILALSTLFVFGACGNDNGGKDNDNGSNGAISSGTASSGSAATSSDNDGDDAVQTLKVGFDAEFPPFGFVAADGSYDGFDLAMAEELCRRLGWGFEAIPIDWTQKDNELASGSINCIWNGFTCTGRENEYTWSDPYVDNSIVIIVKADSGIESLADLAGKNLMVQGASSALEALNSNEDFKNSLGNIVELPDYNAGFMELKMGSVDAIAADLGVARFQISKNDGDYLILSESISAEQYAVGFLLGNTGLRDAVNAELLAMAKDGTMLKIAEKYVDSGLVLESLCMLNGD